MARRLPRRHPARSLIFCGFPAATFGAVPDARATGDAEDGGMSRSYAVVWREGDSPLARGKLELLSTSIRLDGLVESRPLVREMPYETLTSVRVGRMSSDRLDGRPSLMLEQRSGGPISIASVAESGAVAELAERLASMRSESTNGEQLENLSFLPTPGAGDSEGGDIS